MFSDAPLIIISTLLFISGVYVCVYIIFPRLGTLVSVTEFNALGSKQLTKLSESLMQHG